MEANSLTHWGIKGMKWGVRRTPEQLGHKKSKKRENGLSDDRKRINELMKKNVQSLSNQELNDVLNRLGSEDRYKQLTNSKTQKKGESWTKKTMSKVGVLTSAAVSAYIFKVGKKAVSALMEPIIEGAIEGWTGNPIKHSEVDMDDYESDSLTHYGVKGMKWGVRRMRNKMEKKNRKPGKYEKQDLEEFDKASAKYDEAKKRRDSAKESGNKLDEKKASRDMRDAKSKMLTRYYELSTKRSAMADAGRYKSEVEGKTVGKSLVKHAGGVMLTYFGANAVGNVMKATGHESLANPAVIATFALGKAVTYKAAKEASELFAYKRRKTLEGY